MIPESDRRQSPRYCPAGLRAVISLESNQHLMDLTGDVLDISQTGIKIRLDTPTAANMEGKIRILLRLPESGIPLSISGILKHQAKATDLGLQYVDNQNWVDLDKFIFECTKLVKTSNP